MIRKIIKIDAEKCNGCGLCADACHEGAIGMVNGKAELLRDDYCDGLGNCLPVCEAGAISFEEREAAEYDEDAVKVRMAKTEESQLPCGCPDSQARIFTRETEETPSADPHIESELRQWPVQIKLIPTNSPCFDNAHLLIAADCAAYACGDFHRKFMKNKVTIIGCPKLDNIEYSDKLAEIITSNNIKSVTVVRMEVPCCGGIEDAVVTALKKSGKFLPWQTVTLATDGSVLER